MNDELVEILAEGSHKGWMAEKMRQGFADHVFEPIDDAERSRRCRRGDQQGPCWTPPEKHHPDMLSYAELSEPTKEYDRVTVRGVLSGLDAAGYIVSKRLSYHPSDAGA